MKDNETRAPSISVFEVAALLPADEKARILTRYDIKNFAKVFEDTEISGTCLNFFKCGLNVSRAAREMFMHRNTLMYRLAKVRELTGLDIRDFDSAVTFELLYSIYTEKRSVKR